MNVQEMIGVVDLGTRNSELNFGTDADQDPESIFPLIQHWDRDKRF